MVRFGPVELGAAGALFAGLLLGAPDPDIGPAVPAGLSVLGLALYVYTVGLAAAQASSPVPSQPATGYAIGYPLAVVLTILFVAAVSAAHSWPGRRDPGSGLPKELITRTVDVTRAVRRADVPGAADGRLLAGGSCRPTTTSCSSSTTGSASPYPGNAPPR
ncbi:hypothetical protein [Streptomyces sp. NBC_00691]|uniref:aspartate-alanine antiporter-like transporter n=1 Tax=Streptomyces sp. NBC_00691 TaxID=2903671 RepID=UPI002E35C5E2|nr:hypothetical protein [Streptomyces sp. NBC_00691]